MYRHRTLPTWRILRLASTLFVSAFDAGWKGHESATYKVMEMPHGPLYRGFQRMFDAFAAETDAPCERQVAVIEAELKARVHHHKTTGPPHQWTMLTTVWSAPCTLRECACRAITAASPPGV